ncbi:MAG TPA: 50S ribosomal protein L11 methyltransferase, partial [Dongiaceae bacterium]|nr:50S ribosomal protein L11 methyltransferase [Dongiaceae bacterium]
MDAAGGPPLWSIRVRIVADGRRKDWPAAAIDAVEAALAPFAAALSSFEVADGWTVEALSEAEPDRAAVAAALAGLGARLGEASGRARGAARATVARLPHRDWVAVSQRGLKPVRAGRFYVHGSHVGGPPPRGCIALEIDPGLAFGTGHHESTRGCLLALDRLARTRRIARPLDLGCGSGILALAMARLWRAPVLAVDGDARAVTVTRENARANGVADLVRAVKGSGYAAAAVRRRGPFDLIVANILAKPLCRLAPGTARHLAAGGVAVLSGLLVEHEDAVLAAH